MAVGDEIALTREQFERLSRGFFAVREDRRKVVISLVEARLARDLAPRYARQAEQLEQALGQFNASELRTIGDFLNALTDPQESLAE